MAKEIQKKAGVSGNSVAGKSFQIFTVSEELLQKVVEAVQAGEKEARSSGNVQSFEVFCHGFRQNISLGRIMVVPAKVCSDRKNFPTALLHGALIRIFGWGGEEIADLIEKKIGTGEFDEYSQADFDTLKEELFTDKRTGEEASLVVFAPNWMNSREYICFHFSKDAEELKNNLRHQVFSAYYNPSVSSAFNALMTNVNTTKVDVADITPKLSYPFLSENPLKQFPQLEKQAGWKKETILLNRKTADEVTKQTLDPQELDVFDSLSQALEQSLLPDADGAQGEGGFKAPEATPGVPREASVQDGQKNIEAGYKYIQGKIAHIDANGICPGCKKAGGECACENCDCKQACAPHETPFTNVGPGTEAHAEQEASAPAMKESVQGDEGKADEMPGSPIGIAIDEQGVPRRKEEEAKVAAKHALKIKSLHDAQLSCSCGNWSMSRTGEMTKEQAKKEHAKHVKEEKTGDLGTGKLASNPSNRKHDSAHPETQRVDPTRLSSAYSAAYNGGFVDKHAMPPQKVKDYIGDKMGNNDEQAPHAAADHKKQIEAGAYGDDPLSRRSNEKWGSAEIPVKFKRSNKEVMAGYIADVVAAEIDEPSEAISTKGKQARAKKESLLDKFRPKTAVELDIDSIWDAITEDMGPAPLVEIDTDPSNPAPSNTEDQGGWNETSEEGNEAPKGRPNKRDVGDLPEAFRSTEPEEKKEISDSEAESQETDLENSSTQEEENYHGASVDSKYADFIGEVADGIEEEEDERPRMSCDQCQMMMIQGVPCHETGCPNMGARWDAENGMWVKQRECFECGMKVDYDDPCCSAPVMDEAEEARFGSKKEATGEMSQSEADDAEAWPLHHAIAQALGGKVKAFDQYQGPYVLIGSEIRGQGVYAPATPMRGTVRLWIQSEESSDGAFVQVYNEDNRKLSEPFHWSDPQGAVEAAKSVLDQPKAASSKKAGERESWAEWLKTYGGEQLFDSIMRNAQGAESTCIYCGEPIYLDIVEGGGVPDWGTAMEGIDGLDYGCPESPDTGEEGTGSHMPSRKVKAATLRSKKKADTADNGYNIDKAPNPSTKENGPSGTVECHQDYNSETSEGTDRPKPGAGADIKTAKKGKCPECGSPDIDRSVTLGDKVRCNACKHEWKKSAGGVKRMYEDAHEDEYKTERENAELQEGFRREHMLKTIQHGDTVTILVPAGIGRGGQEWAERSGKAVMRSAEGGWVLNMGGPHGTPGLANERNLVSVRKGKKADKGTEEQFNFWCKDCGGVVHGTREEHARAFHSKKKKADTADNPANWHDGEGVIQPKTDADIKDTTGPDALPPGQKKAAEPPMDLFGAIFDLMDAHEKGTLNEQDWQKVEQAYETTTGQKFEGEVEFSTQKLPIEQASAKQADVSGDFSEAKSETVSPDTVDKDIQHPTVSVGEAGKEAADKTALHFMNEYDIDDAVQTLGNDPVLGKAVRFLRDFRDQVNSHSDGWAYWRAPVAAAGQLMTLIEQGMNVRRGRQFQETVPLINDKAIAKAMGPIKSFMTRRGLAAGMEMPKLAADISGDMSEAKSEVDYNKADTADEPKATDTVNPDHFAADNKTACGESQPESVEFDFGAGDLADIVLVEDEEEK